MPTPHKAIVKICARCGEEFTPPKNNNQKFCSECKPLREKERYQNFLIRKRKSNQQQTDILDAFNYLTSKGAREKRLQDQAAARKLGMKYGQYIAWRNAGLI